MKRLCVLGMVTALLLAAGGTALAATVACNGGRCVGGNGPDTMFGSDVRDVIYSLKGQDFVRGNRGSDTLNGGDGNDRIEANDGFTDVISCGKGRRDLVVFDAGLDRFSGCENRVPR